ncbi:MAG: hypothetical protein R3C20_03420 [Planctomycetaceae bacterium]
MWVIDNDDYVYVHDNAGNLLRSWRASGLSRPEGIATDGTDVWIVDRGNDRVHCFADGATRTSNTGTTSSFSLVAGDSRGITTDGTYLWVVDAGTDNVYKYTVGGALLGSWALDSRNTSPQGITIDPANVNDIWVVDSGDDAVYQYSGAASRTSGSQSANEVFALASGNTNPRGIADPPSPSPQLVATEVTLAGEDNWSTPVSASTRTAAKSLFDPQEESPSQHRTASSLSVEEGGRMKNQDSEDAGTPDVSPTDISPRRVWKPEVNIRIDPQRSDFDGWLDVIAEDLLKILS